MNTDGSITLTLSADQLAELAQAVAEVLRAEQAPAAPLQLVDAATVAEALGVSRESVAAMVAWLRLHGQEQAPAGDDPGPSSTHRSAGDHGRARLRLHAPADAC